jgi:hypothetical protein
VDRRSRATLSSAESGRDGQARRGDVHAEHHRAAAQALHRQRVVDLGGGRVVDREGLHGGQRQLRP